MHALKRLVMENIEVDKEIGFHNAKFADNVKIACLSSEFQGS